MESEFQEVQIGMVAIEGSLYLLSAPAKVSPIVPHNRLKLDLDNRS